MNIACIGYREWALRIYERLAKSKENVFLIFRSKELFNEDILINFNPDLVLFYGWSWIVPERILEKFNCLMLHPSPLPKYRGGSPIQNQIISGEKQSKTSIILMNNKMDEGDIVAQDDLSLEGSLKSIFKRIENSGVKLTNQIIMKGLNPIPQNHNDATYCKRRKPEDSEITIDEITSFDAEYLYNKIRMLADPYPNAFIKTIDGKKLLIKEAEIE